MNSYIKAVTSLDAERVDELITHKPSWLNWSERSGKNALHYLCGTKVDGADSKTSLKILKLLLDMGMDINSVHLVEDGKCDFPATPLWYAYTKGRNEPLYRYLLERGADPDNCWWAIAWYDDVEAAELFLSHGAKLDKELLDNTFVTAIYGKQYNFAWWALDCGADINSFAPQDVNALMIAVKRKDEGLINRLISFGADPDAKNEDGESARSIAEKRGPKRLAKMLPDN